MGADSDAESCSEESYWLWILEEVWMKGGCAAQALKILSTFLLSFIQFYFALICQFVSLVWFFHY